MPTTGCSILNHEKCLTFCRASQISQPRSNFRNFCSPQTFALVARAFPGASLAANGGVPFEAKAKAHFFAALMGFSACECVIFCNPGLSLEVFRPFWPFWAPPNNRCLTSSIGDFGQTKPASWDFGCWNLTFSAWLKMKRAAVTQVFSLWVTPFAKGTTFGTTFLSSQINLFGYSSELKYQGSAGFSPWFHLPGFLFEHRFLTHAHFSHFSRPRPPPIWA